MPRATTTTTLPGSAAPTASSAVMTAPTNGDPEHSAITADTEMLVTNNITGNQQTQTLVPITGTNHLRGAAPSTMSQVVGILSWAGILYVVVEMPVAVVAVVICGLMATLFVKNASGTKAIEFDNTLNAVCNAVCLAEAEHLADLQQDLLRCKGLFNMEMLQSNDHQRFMEQLQASYAVELPTSATSSESDVLVDWLQDCSLGLDAFYTDAELELMAQEAAGRDRSLKGVAFHVRNKVVEIDALYEQLEQKDSDIASLREDLLKKYSELDSARDEFEKKNIEVKSLSEDIQQLKGAEKELEAVQETVCKLEKKLRKANSKDDERVSTILDYKETIKEQKHKIALLEQKLERAEAAKTANSKGANASTEKTKGKTDLPKDYDSGAPVIEKPFEFGSKNNTNPFEFGAKTTSPAPQTDNNTYDSGTPINGKPFRFGATTTNPAPRPKDNSFQFEVAPMPQTNGNTSSFEGQADPKPAKCTAKPSIHTHDVKDKIIKNLKKDLEDVKAQLIEEQRAHKLDVETLQFDLVVNQAQFQEQLQESISELNDRKDFSQRQSEWISKHQGESKKDKARIRKLISGPDMKEVGVQQFLAKQERKAQRNPVVEMVNKMVVSMAPGLDKASDGFYPALHRIDPQSGNIDRRPAGRNAFRTMMSSVLNEMERTDGSGNPGYSNTPIDIGAFQNAAQGFTRESGWDRVYNKMEPEFVVPLRKDPLGKLPFVPALWRIPTGANARALQPGYDPLNHLRGRDIWMETAERGIWVHKDKDRFGLLEKRNDDEDPAKFPFHFKVFELQANTGVWYCEEYRVGIYVHKGRFVTQTGDVEDMVDKAEIVWPNTAEMKGKDFIYAWASFEAVTAWNEWANNPVPNNQVAVSLVDNIHYVIGQEFSEEFPEKGIYNVLYTSWFPK